MTRNRTLDEFGGPEETPATPEGQPPTAGPSAFEEEDLEPLSTTFHWAVEGAACASCGDRVGRRWAEDGRLVCESCKDW